MSAQHGNANIWNIWHWANVTVILKNATPLVENRVAHILSFLKSTSFIFLNIFFVQYYN